MHHLQLGLFFEHKCYSCNKTKWLNKDIPLELHHIGGDSSNNIISKKKIMLITVARFYEKKKGLDLIPKT